jgi:hypothetical protein
MVRTQIQLTEQQSRGLHELSVRKGISVAEIIRRSVDQTLRAEILVDPEEIRQRARAAVGYGKDSVTDLSENHDRYLAEAYGE